MDHQGTSLAELRHVLDYQCHMGDNRGQRSFVNYVTFFYRDSSVVVPNLKSSSNLTVTGCVRN